MTRLDQIAVEKEQFIAFLKSIERLRNTRVADQTFPSFMEL